MARWHNTKTRREHVELRLLAQDMVTGAMLLPTQLNFNKHITQHFC